MQSPVILQVQKITNIASPSCQQNEGGTRLLKLQLTDGYIYCNALEIKHTPQLKLVRLYLLYLMFSVLSSLSVPPGTKLKITSNVMARNGFLLLTPSVVKVLGGHVEHMVEKWKASKVGMHCIVSCFKKCLNRLSHKGVKLPEVKAPQHLYHLVKLPASDNTLPNLLTNLKASRLPSQLLSAKSKHSKNMKLGRLLKQPKRLQFNLRFTNLKDLPCPISKLVIDSSSSTISHDPTMIRNTMIDSHSTTMEVANLREGFNIILETMRDHINMNVITENHQGTDHITHNTQELQKTIHMDNLYQIFYPLHFIVGRNIFHLSHILKFPHSLNME